VTTPKWRAPDAASDDHKRNVGTSRARRPQIATARAKDDPVERLQLAIRRVETLRVQYIDARRDLADLIALLSRQDDNRGAAA
jgi:hypothetical protein